MKLLKAVLYLGVQSDESRTADGAEEKHRDRIAVPNQWNSADGASETENFCNSADPLKEKEKRE